MCGFIAQLCFNNVKPNSRLVKSMLRLIQHRGPDSSNIITYEWLSFGFNRLSILDLSQLANQPMEDESGRYSIVYNGELYNYKYLRRDLNSLGYKFLTSSDTEVLLKSYMEWGDKCLEKFEGMFAFCIYDKKANEVFIARDQLGIKPLYYYRKENNFFLASEIKSFSIIDKLRLNSANLGEHFKYGYIADNSTLFKNIYKILPGHFMRINSKGKILKKKYYDIKDSFEIEEEKFDLKFLERKLNESIINHTVSDVGFNIQLSGGLDSSYITAVLKSKLQSEIHTYSVVVKKEKENEEKYQKLVAKKFTTNHHSVSLSSNDYADLLEKATWHMDLPILHAGCPFLMHLTMISRATSKVIITGEGADELFGGYSRYKITLLKKFAYFLQEKKISKNLFPHFIPIFRGVQKLLQTDIGIDDHILNANVSNFLTKFKFKSNFRKNYVKNLDSLIKKIFLTDQRFYLSTLLERQDKMSMAYSVESRVPFSNHKLFEIINRINFKKKVEPTIKYLLKQMCEKYYSQDFIYRKKNGFRLPVDKWMRRKGKMNQMLSMLTDQTFSERGIFKTNIIKKMIDSHVNGKKNNTKELFNLLKFEIWHRLFID